MKDKVNADVADLVKKSIAGAFKDVIEERKLQKERLKSMATDPINRITAKLVRCGFPLDTVEYWTQDKREAFFIILCEQDGHKYDWDKMDWVK